MVFAEVTPGKLCLCLSLYIARFYVNFIFDVSVVSMCHSLQTSCASQSRLKDWTVHWPPLKPDHFSIQRIGGICKKVSPACRTPCSPILALSRLDTGDAGINKQTMHRCTCRDLAQSNIRILETRPWLIANPTKEHFQSSVRSGRKTLLLPKSMDISYMEGFKINRELTLALPWGRLHHQFLAQLRLIYKVGYYTMTLVLLWQFQSKLCTGNAPADFILGRQQSWSGPNHK